MSFSTSTPGLPQTGTPSTPQSSYGDYNVAHINAEAADQIIEATEGFRDAMANFMQDKTGATEAGMRIAATNTSDTLFNLNKLSYMPGVDLGMTESDRKVINAAAVTVDNAIQNGLSNGMTLTGVAQTMCNLNQWAKTALPPPPPPPADGGSFGAGQIGDASAPMTAFSAPGGPGAADASLSVQVTVNLVAVSRANTVAHKATALNAALGALSLQLGGPPAAASTQPGQSFQAAPGSAAATAPNGAADRSEASPLSTFAQNATSMLKSVADLVPHLSIPNAAKMGLQNTLSKLTGLLNQLVQIAGVSQQVGSAASASSSGAPALPQQPFPGAGPVFGAPVLMAPPPMLAPPAQTVQTAQAFQSFAPAFTGGLKDVVGQLGTVQDNTQLGLATSKALDQIAAVVGGMNALASKTA